MTNGICERLGIEFPLFAFSHCRDVVAAVSKAGGYGVLGALAYSPDQLEIELKWIDDNVGGKPYGVDFAIPQKFVGKGENLNLDDLQKMIPQEHKDFAESILQKYDVPPMPPEVEGPIKAAGLGVEAEGPGQIEVALRHPISMIVNALGAPPQYVIDAAHEKGVLVGALAGSPKHARKSVDLGVDVIVAQGTEAGGHTGEIATMVLVPEVVDAVGPDIPVLAAGGIGRGRQMAAAMALGAQGAWTGSIWLTVAEAETPEFIVENLLEAEHTDAVRSRSMTGKPARQLRTPWTEAWDAKDTLDPLPMPLQGILHAPAWRRVIRAKTKELGGYPVGQIVGSMHTVKPAREVVFEIVQEWIETTEKMAKTLPAG